MINRSDQLVMAAAFFRSLVDQDAAGVDVGLANRLLDELAAAGSLPADVQTSCVFDGVERSIGRWTFFYEGEQAVGRRAAVPVALVHDALMGICEFPGDRTRVKALVSAADAGGVARVGIGFDAHVVPDMMRMRLVFERADTDAGRLLPRRIFEVLGIAPDERHHLDKVERIALEYGPSGLADVRPVYPAAIESAKATGCVAAHPEVLALAGDADRLNVIRSLRDPLESRMEFWLAAHSSLSGHFLAWGRRLPLLDDFRLALDTANRTLPVPAGLSMRPVSMAVALVDGSIQPNRISVQLRPHEARST